FTSPLPPDDAVALAVLTLGTAALRTAMFTTVGRRPRISSERLAVASSAKPSGAEQVSAISTTANRRRVRRAGAERFSIATFLMAAAGHEAIAARRFAAIAGKQRDFTNCERRLRPVQTVARAARRPG